MNDELRVLIVDDDKTNRRVLKECISGMAQVLLAKNGSQAIEKSMELQPDLIVLDVVMPDMDGFSVIETLRNRRATQHIPIIFITGSNSEEIELKGLRLGAVDVISKPLHPGVVQARIYTQLQNVFQRRLLDSLAHIDALTTIPNRRQFDEALEHEWQNSLALQQVLTLVILDVDYFKRYNDCYGHQSGDQVLKKVALTLKACLNDRQSLVARIGGEEFAMILPNVNLAQAQLLVDKAILQVKQLNIPHNDSKCEQVITLSAGIHSFIAKQITNTKAAFELADKALFKAKANGRNQYAFTDNSQAELIS
ncbi:diguanylate cyclase [Catenovulum sp. 2E275]|uniref:diguanylate cyclase domain-containing protein n=1 Tax=Catenovulum sp. 2E275 TaxID=2980497 RepID=UPI0021D1EDCB|nr:diguanylate cyclase [Catenovulum sp. 2E275]MCU4675322.1 diguanylate cyclase [Catenovulum sp. 2E275]